MIIVVRPGVEWQHSHPKINFSGIENNISKTNIILCPTNIHFSGTDNNFTWAKNDISVTNISFIPTEIPDFWPCRFTPTFEPVGTPYIPLKLITHYS